MPAASPAEILKIQEQARYIPEAVFEVVNQLLAKKSGKYKTIMQESVIEALVDKGYTRSEIFDEHYLDFEPAYRAAGWKVEYDKPAYNETYEANWKFESR